MGTKTCSRCSEIKPLTDFHKDKKTKDGLYYICKACRAENSRRYYQNNKKYFREYLSKRYHSDELFAQAMKYRAITYFALKGQGFSERGSAKKLLGCTYEQLVQHFESLFHDGMSWNNRKEWHIDHIKSLSTAKNKDELVALCHFSNLQPLWAFDNFSKGPR